MRCPVGQAGQVCLQQGGPALLLQGEGPLPTPTDGRWRVVTSKVFKFPETEHCDKHFYGA